MATTTAASSAASFVNSIGVNMHLDSGGAYANLAAIEADLRYLGVSNVRDSASNGGDFALWSQVAQATGVKFDDYIGETSVAGMNAELALMAPLANAGILNALEGGNEEDNAYPASLGNTLAATAAFQGQLYTLATQLGLPAINMSFGDGWTAANNWHGNYDKVGDLSAIATYANAHVYPAAAPAAIVQQLNTDAHLAASTRPIINTEFGYNLQVNDPTQAAKWTLDGLLDAWSSGDVQTYLYGLVDDSSGNWGLFNADGTARPAATAIHNLVSLLSDTGSGGGSLAYSLTDSTGGLNSTLLAKSDGTFWLALWNETSGADAVTLNLANAATQIQVFDPLTGTTAIQSVSNSATLNLTLPDHPLLVEIGGAGTATANVAPTAAITTPAPATAPTTPAASTTPATPTPAATTSGPVLTGGDEANNFVATLNGTTVTAGNGANTVFLSGTGDNVTLGNGGNVVQGYQGGNTITTGAGNDTIQVAGSGNVINAGGGQNTIADSGSGNTIVLPDGGGNDTIYGYVLQNNDTLDLRSALAATSWNNDPATLGSFIAVATVNNSAVISLSPTGTGGGSVIATLQDSGSISLAALLAHSQV